MSATSEHDVVVVGGGTAGCFAAATAAGEGLDVALLERKTEDEAGHISCGDALKGKAAFPDVIDLDYLAEESFTNEHVRRGIFENPQTEERIDIPLPEEGKIVDRKRYGEVLLEEAERAGTEIRYDTVVQDVDQDDDGRVTGVTARTNGSAERIEADVVIDGAGALSVLQDEADFGDATFDTNVKYTQFCSAYREILDVDEPVDYDDAIYFKPAEELGYIWYFPRTPTRINVGLGFQMDREPMELVEALRRDVEQRPEFQGAEVVDKLGAALPTRRPYDSAVAPGFAAVGDAAGHVNPTTGGGIPGAAKAGAWAAEAAIDAVTEGDADEPMLWEYNRRVMQDFGKDFAAMDLYNIFGTAHEVDELTDLVTAVPGQKLVDALGSGTAEMGLWLKLKTLFKTFGHWSLLYELYQVHEKAAALKELYGDYPATPDGLDAWQNERDAIMDDVYAITGAEPKY